MKFNSLTALAIAAIAIGIGVFAYAGGPRPNYVGFIDCIELHPDKYCRTMNGMPPRD